MFEARVLRSEEIGRVRKRWKCCIEFDRSREIVVEIPSIRGVKSVSPDGGDFVVGRLSVGRHDGLSLGSFSEALPCIRKPADWGNSDSLMVVYEGSWERLGVVRIYRFQYVTSDANLLACAISFRVAVSIGAQSFAFGSEKPSGCNALSTRSRDVVL